MICSINYKVSLPPMDNSYSRMLLSAFQGNTTKAGLFKFSMGKNEEFLSAMWVVFMTHL